MATGDRTAGGTPLPGRPVGMLGTVKEVGTRLAMVEFDDGRWGYYRPDQLQRAKEDF
jgi:hypothetical protein